MTASSHTSADRFPSEDRTWKKSAEDTNNGVGHHCASCSVAMTFPQITSADVRWKRAAAGTAASGAPNRSGHPYDGMGKRRAVRRKSAGKHKGPYQRHGR